MKNIRPTTAKDLGELERIYDCARKFMKANGNPNQWRDDKPNLDEVVSDISRGVNYVVAESGKVVGTFSAVLGIDPTYKEIDGKWLNDEPYVTIHKIASDGTSNGILSCAVSFCASIAKNIRIDTHEDNKVMRHLLEKSGFQYCGVIKLANGEPRLAYQKILSE